MTSRKKPRIPLASAKVRSLPLDQWPAADRTACGARIDIQTAFRMVQLLDPARDFTWLIEIEEDLALVNAAEVKI